VRALAKVFTVTLLLFLTAFSGALAAGDVRVLIYHRVGDSRYPSTNIDTGLFQKQMEWLREAGYTVIPTKKLEGFLFRGEDIPKKSVVIHFDDGYRSVYRNAWPILRKLGYPFAMTIPVYPVERGWSDYATWGMLHEMAAQGVEIGSHGSEHSRLGGPKRGESETAYLARVRDEAEASMRILKREGFDPAWIAYPYGEFNDTVAKIARETGYRFGFTQDPGPVALSVDRFLIPRFAVVGAVSDFELFKERMGYEPLELLSFDPAPGKNAGGRVEGFTAKVADPEKYLPGEVNVFLSESGRRRASFDPSLGVVKAEGAVLTKRVNRLIITLKSRATGHYAFVSRLVLNPEKSE
jgi:peptidoglycan/xylan/chitin deacetylase (PgdA/CDA1 family)